jgi:hypothetical protein
MIKPFLNARTAEKHRFSIREIIEVERSLQADSYRNINQLHPLLVMPLHSDILSTLLPPVLG